MAGHPAAVVPTDPFMWHESVLSTRSLSYMSTVSALGTNPLPSPLTSRNPSVVFMSRPHDAMDEESEDDLEMTRRDTTTRTILPESVANSLLFDLPREIRDRIYSYCLTATERPGIEWPVPPSIPLFLCPQLLRTCKIVFSEAAQVLYSSNRFVFTHPSDANVFVRAICSRLYTGLISSLELQIRAQDTRLWAPYLTSQNLSRSLRHDFANLRDLTINYKSIRWHQHAPITTNLRAWREDRPLIEIMNSLRVLYFPKSYPTPNSRHADLLQLYLPEPDPIDGARSDVDMSAELEQRAQVRETIRAERAGAPFVKVVCMLKIPLADFGIITSTAALGPSWHSEIMIDPQELTTRSWTPGSTHPTWLRDIHAPPQTPAELHTEDVPTFPPYARQDFHARARRIDGRKPLYGAHTAVAARSTFAEIDGIFFALELYSHLPEK